MYNRVIEQSVRPHDSRRVFTVQPTGAHWRTQAAGPSRQRQQSRLEQWCGVHTVEHLSSCGLGHRHLGRQPRQASKISWNNLAKTGLKSMCSKNPKTTQMLRRGVLCSCQWQAGKQDSGNMRKKTNPHYLLGQVIIFLEIIQSPGNRCHYMYNENKKYKTKMTFIMSILDKITKYIVTTISKTFIHKR